MPRHSAHAIRFHYCEKRKRDAPSLYLNALPDSSDFLDLACEAWDHIQRRDETTERSFDTLPAQRSGRVALFKGRVGHYGAPAQIRDVNTGEVHFNHEGNLANEPEVRLVLAVPPSDCVSAYMIVEEIKEGTLKKPYLDALDSLWRERYPQHTLKTTNVVESEAWLETASLAELNVIYLDQQGDLADGENTQIIGQIHSTLRPSKGKLLPRKAYDIVRDNPHLAGKLIGHATDELPDSVTVKMRGQDGREKTFAIDNERPPMARWLFSDAGEPSLDDAQHIDRCLDEVRDLLRREGQEWDTRWQMGE